MKKKSWLRFLSLILCLCFALFSFAGCGNKANSGSGGDPDASDIDDEGDDEEDEEGEEFEPTLLAGVKALSRPENYDFDDAVGDFSENFYNIFSKYIMEYLYKTYAVAVNDLNPADQTAIFNENSDSDYKDLERNAGVETTYPLSNEDTKYYFYDTPRYQIKSIVDTEESGDVVKQTLTLDTSKAWLWGMNTDVSGQNATNSIFKNYTETDPKITENIAGDTITIVFDDANGWWQNGWVEVYANASIPEYSNLYYGAEVDKDGTTIIDHFTSPYEAYGATGLNYYQDALEYAIYMIVLGYDHVNDAAYFDFTISDALKNGAPTATANITVGGWESNKISVADALTRAKERYKLTANYIGVANKDLDTIADFIVKKVIGQESKFTININGTHTAFNHNYEAIVHNIIRYACDKAPIGNDKDGTPIHLADTYLTSKITDYEGDYFGIAFDLDENGEYVDSNLFSNIEAAEYQSIVFMPKAEDVGKKLTDVWLSFEYFDLPEGSAKVMDTENGITINVGIRYYDSVTGTIYQIGETQITIKYAKNGNHGPEGNPLCFGEGDAGVDISFSHTPLIQTAFISPTEIDAQKEGQPDGSGDFRKSIQMTGANKDYYKLNDSSSYGQYGTLNEAAFVGENACDFVEVYFDIVKDKNAAANKSYSFKVGATIFFEDV